MGEKTLKKERENEKQNTSLPKKEKVIKIKSSEDDLPPFPEEDAKGLSVSPGGELEEEKLSEEDIEGVCGDIIGEFFKLWNLLDKKRNIEPLDAKEKKALSKPMSRLAVKYHVQELMKDEFYFLFVLGVSISKRITIKKDDKHDSGKKREGEDNFSKGVDKE